MDATLRQRTVSARQAADLAGCTYRMLDYWLRTGVLRCTVEAAGSGSRRRFTVSDVAALQLVRRLRELDVPLDTVRSVTASLYDSDTPWTGPVVVTRDGLVFDLAEVMVGLHPGIAGWVVDLTPSS